ncbi:MAG: WecB/TagA/CpsF family glycosyltransferase [Gammaproteobacteria bacterium]|nr:WecB/TagA/CpsF family glycosyltransferase [Gammaproteobacteria bacterium]
MTKQPILAMDVDVTSLASAVDKVLQLVEVGHGAYVCVSNVHMCMEAFDSANFSTVVNRANLVIPDGKPLSVAQRLLGHRNAAQVRGQDIMNALCAISGEKSINIGFYGGSSDEILESVKLNLRNQNPEIKITYAFSPPFRALSAGENLQVVAQINAAEVDVLFVGIGCPKQELWMAENKNQLNCVMLGVGAAFDFIAGEKRHAPRWIQMVGLEWLFRLVSEPKRLWKRYLKQNPRFIWHFGKQLVRYKLQGQAD